MPACCECFQYRPHKKSQFQNKFPPKPAVAGVDDCQKKTDLSSGIRIMRTTLSKLTLKSERLFSRLLSLVGLVVSEVSGRRKCRSSEEFLVFSFAGLEIIQERLHSSHSRPAVSHGSPAHSSQSAYSALTGVLSSNQETEGCFTSSAESGPGLCLAGPS